LGPRSPFGWVRRVAGEDGGGGRKEEGGRRKKEEEGGRRGEGGRRKKGGDEEKEDRGTNKTSHTVPPNSAGTEIVLVLLCVPVPQSKEHVFQSVHVDHTQFTGAGSVTTVNATGVPEPWAEIAERVPV
jgi:hypothetical protein